MVLQVLAFVSERERENILHRQAEGIAVAKAQGKHLGRPRLTMSSLNKEQKNKIVDNYPKWKSKEITGVQFMTLLELKKNSFYKIIGEYEKTL